jgi:cytochrome c553
MRKVLYIALVCSAFAAAPALAVDGDPTVGRTKTAECVQCHGSDGNSKKPANPKLAGQSAEYIYKQLMEFKSGERVNNIMNEQAAALSEQDMKDIAAYYEAQTPISGTADETVVALGEALFRGGNSATGVPACMACHGPAGEGNPGAKFPRLAGQWAEYTESQLHAFRKAERANDAGKMMRNIAIKMTDAEITAVSEYIAGLQP